MKSIFCGEENASFQSSFEEPTLTVSVLSAAKISDFCFTSSRFNCSKTSESSAGSINKETSKSPSLEIIESSQPYRINLGKPEYNG
ncbi:MAG: hypothetical protein V1493_04690, partial [Candidatus Diapherotrites archaeon]